MTRQKEKTIRQRRPEVFLYWLKRHWVDDRAEMMLLLTGRRTSGRPRGCRCLRVYTAEDMTIR